MEAHEGILMSFAGILDMTRIVGHHCYQEAGGASVRLLCNTQKMIPPNQTFYRKVQVVQTNPKNNLFGSCQDLLLLLGAGVFPPLIDYVRPP